MNTAQNMPARSARRFFTACGALLLYALIAYGFWRLFENGGGTPLGQRLLVIIATLAGLSIDLIRFKYRAKAAREQIRFGLSLGLTLGGAITALALAAVALSAMTSDEVAWCLVLAAGLAAYGMAAGAFVCATLFLNLAILAGPLLAAVGIAGFSSAPLAFWSSIFEIFLDSRSLTYQWMAAVFCAAISGVIVGVKELSY